MPLPPWPDDAGLVRPPTMAEATGEFDAIVLATERATSDILNRVERIQALANQLPREGALAEIASEIVRQATEVLTACAFQDITGQRTNKLASALFPDARRPRTAAAIAHANQSEIDAIFS